MNSSLLSLFMTQKAESYPVLPVNSRDSRAEKDIKKVVDIYVLLMYPRANT